MTESSVCVLKDGGKMKRGAERVMRGEQNVFTKYARLFEFGQIKSFIYSCHEKSLNTGNPFIFRFPKGY